MPDTSAAADARLPVTLLSRCPGAGKATLLNRLLAVIVNDMSDVNIDADLVRTGGRAVAARRNPRHAFQRLHLRHAAGRSADRAALPPVAAAVEFRDADGRSPADVARLDAMVTVVDAAQLRWDYACDDCLADRGAAAGKVARALTADAKIPECDRGAVEAGTILGAGLCDPDRAHAHPIRAKGHFRLAMRSDTPQARACPDTRRQAPWGDRRQKYALIGAGLGDAPTRSAQGAALAQDEGRTGGAPDVLHRAPPIEDGGEARLLCALDLPGEARQ